MLMWYIYLGILIQGALFVVGQDNCNVQAIQRCTIQFASQISPEDTPSVVIICRAYRAFQKCLDPHKENCRDNAMFNQMVNAQASIASQCGATDGEPDCDILTVSTCFTDYTSSVENIQSPEDTCRLVSELKACIDPHKADCAGDQQFRYLSKTLRSTEAICGDGSGCNIVAVSTCFQEYSTSVEGAQTRLQTCNLVHDLRDCVRPHSGACANHETFRSISTTLEATNDVCGDGSGCNIVAVSTCFQEYSTSVGGAQTRLQTCNLVQDLKDCVRPHSGACANHETFRSISTTLEATNDICGDPLEGDEEDHCNTQLLTSCLAEYIDATVDGMPSEEVCRSLTVFKNCLTPLGRRCFEESLFQRSIRIIEGKESACEYYENSCRDWNNTFIPNGEVFSPNQRDPCYRCACDEGRMVACRSVECLPPPCERGVITAVEGVCCRFTCHIEEAETEPEPIDDVSGGMCRDWNNTLISSGEMFSPKASDLCYRCGCHNGRSVACRSVTCMRPPCEGVLTPVEGVCCRFVCTIEPEPSTDGESCRDWNNTVVPHGETFSPERSEPCYQCACYNGRRVSCMDVGCMRPPCEGGTLTPVEGECCHFICRIGPQQEPEPNTVPEECPEGWTMYGSKCYYLSRDKMNWIDSQMMCETINGKLVQIVSANENSFVRNFTSTSGISNFWIGVTDLEVLGTYKYPGEDGPIQFSDWKRRRPVVSKRFNCVEIKTAKVYNWRPTNCSKRLPFVCEREP